MLVITKSLCGFVSNQVQYNMESAQYLEQTNYIIMMNKYILDIYIQFMEFRLRHLGFMESKSPELNSMNYIYIYIYIMF